MCTVCPLGDGLGGVGWSSKEVHLRENIIGVNLSTVALMAKRATQDRKVQGSIPPRIQCDMFQAFLVNIMADYRGLANITDLNEYV